MTGGGETILVVEDEAPVRVLVRSVLTQRGYRVIEAAGPAEALRAVQGHAESIDLVISDVVMPGMTGPELVERLPAGLRVLFMSGYSEPDVRQKGLMRPGAAFVEKPFTPDALAKRVRALLDAPRP